MRISTPKASVYLPGFHPIKVFKLWNMLRKLTPEQAQALGEQARAQGWTVKQTVIPPH